MTDSRPADRDRTGQRLSLAAQAVVRADMRADGDRGGSHPVAAWRSAERFDVTALRSRLSKLLATTPMLRAAVTGRGRRARLVLALDASSDGILNEVTCTADEFGSEYDAIAKRDFDLSAPPQLSVTVVHLPAADVLVVAASALVADDDTVDHIGAVLTDPEPGLPGTSPSDPELTDPELADTELTDYGTYVDAEAEQLARWAQGTESTDFWARRLAGAPAPRHGDSSRSRCVVNVDQTQWAALTAAAESGQNTPAHNATRTRAADTAALAGLVAAALGAAGDSRDVVLGVAHPSTSTLSGSTANYLPLRLTVHDSESAGALTARAQAELGELAAHADVRGEWLAHRHGTDGALFSVVVSVAASGPSDLQRRQLTRPEGVDLAIRLQIGESNHTLAVDAPAATAHAVAASLTTLISRWAADAAAPVGDSIGRQGESDIVAAWRPALTETADAQAGQPPGGAPATDRELLLADTIRTVLALEPSHPIGRDDTFFTLGGDSVGALKVVTAVAERGYVIDVESVFAHPEIAQIAERMTTATTDPADTAPIDPLAASGLDASTLATLTTELGGR